jgi:hypothetical protein
VQGNSGSGKSHLLRRLLEQSAGLVQQVIIDPEGDFVSIADTFGHLVVEASDYTETDVAVIAARVRENRVSVVLNLEGLEVDAQLRCAGALLNGLFEAPREHWYPALVVVDEAQLFAPAAAGEVGEEARRVSLAAMTNLMCRGRKRGLAGVIATQRLAKLAKNVAAEASNFLMGRTFLDIDMARAADLLGMERRQAEQIRDLERGQFLALGPAVARRPLLVKIGDVTTGARAVAPKLSPLPALAAEDRDALLIVPREASPPPAQTRRPVEPIEALLDQADQRAPVTASVTLPSRSDQEVEQIIDQALREIVGDDDAASRSAASLHQDFAMRCRLQGLTAVPLNAREFARRLACARAGLFAAEVVDATWAPAFELADGMAEDIVGVFLLIARAARDALPCPSYATLARAYGTESLGRVRRLLSYMEGKAYIAFRTDLRGRRTASIPSLGWSTTAEASDAVGSTDVRSAA